MVMGRFNLSSLPFGLLSHAIRPALAVHYRTRGDGLAEAPGRLVSLATPEGVCLPGSATFYGHSGIFRNPTVIPPNNRVHAFRGLCHYEFGTAAADAIEDWGFHLMIHRYDPGAEGNLLRPWRENTADIFRRFMDYPEDIGENPVFIGHSAGGFPVYMLAALAQGGNVGEILRALPGLAGVDVYRLYKLKDLLQDAIFVTIAAPLNGLYLTERGRWAAKRIAEPLLPDLLSSMMADRLNELYEKIRARPEDVLDDNVYCNTDRVGTTGIFRLVVNAPVHGALLTLAGFLDHDGQHDLIAPLRSTRLPSMKNGSEQVAAPFNHLEIVTHWGAGELLAGTFVRARARRHGTLHD